MKSVLITGVNGGIGGACADEFKSHGYHVYGTDKAEVTNGAADEFSRVPLPMKICGNVYLKISRKKTLL